eukprot:1097314-Amphidinium_carterae.1
MQERHSYRVLGALVQACAFSFLLSSKNLPMRARVWSKAPVAASVVRVLASSKDERIVCRTVKEGLALLDEAET